MAQSPYHPRVAKKAFRAKAKQEGMTFKAAAEARTQQLKEQKFLSPARVPRRNPGRMDGVTWKGSSFICPHRIDGPATANLFDDTSIDVDFEWFQMAELDWLQTLESEPPSSRRDALVIQSLLDIAQPAKKRGVAKDFETIHGVRGVITLEDYYDYDGSSTDYEGWSEVDLECYQEESDDDWEELYEEEREKQKSYAAVLKEK